MQLLSQPHDSHIGAISRRPLRSVLHALRLINTARGALVTDTPAGTTQKGNFLGVNGSISHAHLAGFIPTEVVRLLTALRHSPQP